MNTDFGKITGPVCMDPGSGPPDQVRGRLAGTTLHRFIRLPLALSGC
jgi:hypothetical protein